MIAETISYSVLYEFKENANMRLMKDFWEKEAQRPTNS